MSSSASLILDSIFFEVPNVSILEGVYLEVIPGKTTALFGRNGAGKSTLLKIAAGQLQAGSGITIIDGQRIHKRSLDKRFRKIGYLPQKSMLPDEISVNRLLKAIPATNDLFGVPFVQRVLAQKVTELSGGERRFLEIAILLSLDKTYFLLDEPFTGVDPFIVDEIIYMIKEKASLGKGILLTDHLHRYVSNIADEAYLLHEKQCLKLNNDFTKALKELGYIR